jgi:hypothetical protein
MYVPEQIEHGLIVHHLARRDQHSQDDAAFASLHDVVRVVAQVSSSSFEAHWSGIRIGGTDPKVSSSLVGTSDVPLLPTSLCNPVVSGSIVHRKFLSLFLRDGGGQSSGGPGRSSIRGPRFVTGAFFSSFRLCCFGRKKGG